MGTNLLFNIFVVICVTIIAVIGDVFLKAATTSTGIKYIVNLGLGVLIYGLVAFGFYYMYKLMDFSSSGVIYALVTIILYMGVGFFLYKEVIHVQEWIGLVLAITAIYLLAKFA